MNVQNLHTQKEIKQQIYQESLPLSLEEELKLGTYLTHTFLFMSFRYEIVLKLVRCGATVLVTTRFPHDCACRLAKVIMFLLY